MDISALSGSNWFRRLEMDLISAVSSLTANKVQSAGTAAPDPASSADPSATTDASPPAPTPPPPPPAASTHPLADSMLSTLISLQTDQSLASQASASLIKALDANGDGSLSLAEANTAMGGANGSDGASPAAKGFAKLDSNGDGQLSADELTAAMQALEQSAQSIGGRRHHHHHHSQVADAQPTATTTPPGATTAPGASATTTTDPAAADATVPAASA